MNKVIKNELFEKDYIKDLEKIKKTIKENQNKAMVVVNSAMILTYYEIGTIINMRKTWGSKYVQKLSNDLSTYGKGYSKENLYRMSKFAYEISREELLSQPATQIPWFTIVEILIKCKSHDEILWYINETYKNGWSRSFVLNQIAMNAYERNLISPQATSYIKEDNSLSEIFKDTYVFNFIDKENIKSEMDLENALVDNVVDFLRELGQGFAFVGKEYKIKTPTEEEFYIDLLMYNIKIHSYIVIEIKTGKFKPEYLGQLIFYVNAIDDLEKGENDNKTIGLILCKEADKYTAKTTLSSVNIPLGISKYKFIEELPKYLEEKLNKKINR